MPKYNSNSASNENKRSIRRLSRNKTLKSINNKNIDTNSDLISNTNDNKLLKKKTTKSKTKRDNNNNSNCGEQVIDRELGYGNKAAPKQSKTKLNDKSEPQLDIDSIPSESCANLNSESDYVSNDLDSLKENNDNKKKRPRQTSKKDSKGIDVNNSNKDDNSLQNNTILRRSSRIRKATQLYSQEVNSRYTVKSKKSKSFKLEPISEERNETDMKCSESQETSDETHMKTVINSISSLKPTKKRRSIGRKSIGKSKFRYRKSLSNYKRLNFVEKGNLEMLHKKLGLISKRLSVIPETHESSEESDS